MQITQAALDTDTRVHVIKKPVTTRADAGMPDDAGDIKTLHDPSATAHSVATTSDSEGPREMFRRAILR